MEVLVKHRRYGEVVVEATGRTEAIVRAAVIWDKPFTEVLPGAKVGLRREDLERLREQGRQDGGTAGTGERIPTALRASE